MLRLLHLDLYISNQHGYEQHTIGDEFDSISHIRWRDRQAKRLPSAHVRYGRWKASDPCHRLSSRIDQSTLSTSISVEV